MGETVLYTKYFILQKSQVAEFQTDEWIIIKSSFTDSCPAIKIFELSQFTFSLALVSAFGQNTDGAAWTVSFLFDKIISNLTTLNHEAKIVTDTVGLLVALADTKEK